MLLRRHGDGHTDVLRRGPEGKAGPVVVLFVVRLGEKEDAFRVGDARRSGHGRPVHPEETPAPDLVHRREPSSEFLLRRNSDGFRRSPRHVPAGSFPAESLSRLLPRDHSYRHPSPVHQEYVPLAHFHGSHHEISQGARCETLRLSRAPRRAARSHQDGLFVGVGPDDAHAPVGRRICDRRRRREGEGGRHLLQELDLLVVAGGLPASQAEGEGAEGGEEGYSGGRQGSGGGGRAGRGGR
mmetsp:Transcript_26828/g.53554  ORF Transcript_26828/g.53554 Transcript_26828/m.53554 type:complete len:240 (-) Transcript_26828:126-845(-)